MERLFQGELVTTYTCTETDEKNEKAETFMKLSCNITSTTSFLIEGLREVPRILLVNIPSVCLLSIYLSLSLVIARDTTPLRIEVLLLCFHS